MGAYLYDYENRRLEPAKRVDIYEGYHIWLITGYVLLWLIAEILHYVAISRCVGGGDRLTADRRYQVLKMASIVEMLRLGMDCLPSILRERHEPGQLLWILLP